MLFYVSPNGRMEPTLPLNYRTEGGVHIGEQTAPAATLRGQKITHCPLSAGWHFPHRDTQMSAPEGLQPPPWAERRPGPGSPERGLRGPRCQKGGCRDGAPGTPASSISGRALSCPCVRQDSGRPRGPVSRGSGSPALEVAGVRMQNEDLPATCGPCPGSPGFPQPARGTGARGTPGVRGRTRHLVTAPEVPFT